MSRIESGKMQVSNTAFNMRELLDTVIQLETNPARRKNWTFNWTARHPSMRIFWEIQYGLNNVLLI